MQRLFGKIEKDLTLRLIFYNFIFSLESLLTNMLKKKSCFRNDINPVCSFSVTTPNA